MHNSSCTFRLNPTLHIEPSAKVSFFVTRSVQNKAPNGVNAHKFCIFMLLKLMTNVRFNYSVTQTVLTKVRKTISTVHELRIARNLRYTYNTLRYNIAISTLYICKFSKSARKCDNEIRNYKFRWYQISNSYVASRRWILWGFHSPIILTSWTFNFIRIEKRVPLKKWPSKNIK